MRLLLHACCGPCLIEPLEDLSEFADSVVIAYANSNIHPAKEYERRRDTLRAYAAGIAASVCELDYQPEAWMEQVGLLADSGPARCRACYRFRLRQAAGYAAEHGFDALATTLTVSPYQNPEVIREEGEAAAAEAGVMWLHRDYRSRYAEATRRSRELGMYRQSYCGCVFSESEAREERAHRRAQRAADRARRQSTGGSDVG